MARKASKTKSMLFSTPQKLTVLPTQSLKIAVNDSVVEQVKEAKILGVTFNHILPWERHIESLSKKLNNRISLLRRIKSYLTHKGSLHYLNACIHSQLLYCFDAWGTCSQTLLLCLLRAQKRTSRIILLADYSTPSVVLFS